MARNLVERVPGEQHLLRSIGTAVVTELVAAGEMQDERPSAPSILDLEAKRHTVASPLDRTPGGRIDISRKLSDRSRTSPSAGSRRSCA